MKKILNSFFVTIMALIAFSSCSDVDSPYEINNNTTKGTKENPFTVSEAIINQNGKTAWVKGYIVGGITSDNNISSVENGSEILFSSTNVRASAIVISDSINENNYRNCLVIGFSDDSNEAKKSLNLKDTPSNLGKEILIYGNLTNAFSFQGMKTITDFVLNGQEGTDPGETGKEIFSETFETSQGKFTINDVNKPDGLTFIWKHDATYKQMKASAFANNIRYESESWLISPEINLSEISKAILTFEHAANYFSNAKEEMTVWIKEVNTNIWNQLTIPTYPAKDWKFVSSGNIDISNYIGKEIQFGFKYISNNTSAATWEIQNVKIMADGKGEEEGTTGGGGTGGTITGENLLDNASFEKWTDSKPDNWNTNLVGNAVITQSDDAHEGTYAVLITNSDQNKRLASTEMTLDAGTYTLATYAKNAKNGSSAKIRLGYVTVENGAATGNSDYQYMIDPTTVTDEWAQYSSGEFTLDAQKTISIIIMSSKSSADVLVDDVILIKK